MGSPGVHAPTRLGRYELLGRLATGGMGEIFLARLEGAAGFEKLFVVKRILPHLADDVRFRAMLIDEARIASKIAHANICQVYELGETDGQLYIVMEHLEGVPLLAVLRKASKQGRFLDLGLIGAVVQQCTDALHYAHELRDRDNEVLGIVHRDVTPGNIFLTEAGMVKLLDFGIAKVKDAKVTTTTGTIKGKYAYMAPEQLRGVGVDRRADVFALGVVIFELLALRRLFQRKTDYLTFRAVMEQPIPDVRRFRPDLPDELAEVIARALDREPDRRPATARQLGTSLLDALSTLGRPWSQGELGDHVRTHFAEEIERRRAATSRVLEPAPGTEGGEPPEDDEDDSFPTVEPPSGDPPASHDSGGGSLQPFGLDPRTSGGLAAVQPMSAVAPPPVASPMLATATTPPPAVVASKRGIVWPLLGLAMVGITAVALVLVWKQTQQPKEVIITREPARDPAGEPAMGEPATDDDPPPAEAGRDAGSAGAGAGGASAEVGRPPARSARSARSNPYTAVIKSFRPQMNKCVQDNPLPPGNVKMVIVVATTGRPKTVSFEPGSLDATPAGACIRSALSTATFPPAKEERTVTVPVSVPVKPS